MSIVEDLVVEMLGDTKDMVGVRWPFVKWRENKIIIRQFNLICKSMFGQIFVLFLQFLFSIVDRF